MSERSEKITIRVSEEFLGDLEEYYEENGYDTMSAAVRDVLGEVVGEDSLPDDEEQLPRDKVYRAFAVYAAGIDYRDPYLAAAGIDLLYELDEDLGEMAEKYLVGGTCDPI